MDFFAGIVELAGCWTLGNKKKIGFLLNLLSNILWIFYVLAFGTTYGLLLVVVPAAFINIRNYLNWVTIETCNETNHNQNKES